MTIMTRLSQRKKVKTSSLVASSLMKNELRNVPRASEVKMPKMQIELTRKIW